MRLNYRLLFRSIVSLTSLETVVGYLNKYDKKYDHLRLQEAVLSCFKGSLLDEMKTIADFKQTWFDLDSLMRVGIGSGLKPEHHKILTSYCSAEAYGQWRGIGDTVVVGYTNVSVDEYTDVWEGEVGLKAIAKETWEDLLIGLFSSVWDVVSGRVEILECVVDSAYCRNLFVVGHRRQVYCDPLCRNSAGMRKSRSKNRVGISGKTGIEIRV